MCQKHVNAASKPSRCALLLKLSSVDSLLAPYAGVVVCCLRLRGWLWCETGLVIHDSCLARHPGANQVPILTRVWFASEPQGRVGRELKRVNSTCILVAIHNPVQEVSIAALFSSSTDGLRCCCLWLELNLRHLETLTGHGQTMSTRVTLLCCRLRTRIFLGME